MDKYLMAFCIVVLLILTYYFGFKYDPKLAKKENFYLLNQYNQARSDPAADNNIYTFRGTDIGIESPTFDVREKELQKIGYRDHDTLSRNCEFCR